MKAQIIHFWRQRSAAERRSLSIGAVVLGIALFYALLWYPLTQERNHLRETLPQLRAAAAQMQIEAAETLRLRNMPQKSVNPNLREALEYAAVHSSIGAPSQFIPIDAERVRIIYNATAFDRWIDWAKILQTEHRVRIESVEIFALGEPGMVKVQAVLAPTGVSP